jgi:hypothetical protein
MKRYRFPIRNSSGRVFLALALAIGVWGLAACGSSSSNGNGNGEPGTFVFTSDNMVDAAGYGVSALTTFDGVSQFVALIVELLGPSQSLEPVSQEFRLTPMEVTDLPICLDGRATLTSSDFLAPNTQATLSFEGCKIDPDPEYFILNGNVVLSVSRYNAEAGPEEPFLEASLTIDVDFDEVLDGQRELGNFSTRDLPLRAFQSINAIAFEYGLRQEVLFTARQTEPSISTIKFGCFEVRIEYVVGDGDLRVSRVSGNSAVVVDNRAFGVQGGLGTSGGLIFEVFDGEPVPREGGLQYFSELPRTCRAIGAPEGITPRPSAMKLFPGEQAPQMVLELYPNGFNQPKTVTEEFSWFDID